MVVGRVADGSNGGCGLRRMLVMVKMVMIMQSGEKLGGWGGVAGRWFKIACMCVWRSDGNKSPHWWKFIFFQRYSR